MTTAPFTAAFVVLAGLAVGPAPADLTAAAPGVVWLAVLVSAVPLSRTVAATEAADDSWDLLRGLVRPGALLTGKVGAVWLGLLAHWLLVSALVVVLFELPLRPAAVAAGVLGTLALAGLTTALGVLVAAGARRRGLLSALLLPAGLPALLAGTQLATPDVPAVPWTVMMVLYAAVVLAACWAVFPALLEE